MSVQWDIHTLNSVESTQDEIISKYKLSPDLKQGYCIHALSQTHGKGRHGRVWENATDNLYLSFIIKPDLHLNQIGQISLITSLALNKTIVPYLTDIKPILKWPNDILINGKKCAGILPDVIDSANDVIKALVIGIGVNINTAPIGTSTALRQSSNKEIDLETFRDDLLVNFSAYYDLYLQNGFEKFQYEWTKNSFPKGTKVSVKINDNQISGAFETIDQNGNMIIICDTTNALRKITSGDVFVL